MPPSPASSVPSRGARPSRARKAGERGVSWVSMLLLVAAVTAGYLGWVWVPLYVDHYEARQITRDYMNRAVKDRNDAGLVAALSTALARIGQERVTDEDGNEWEAPSVDVPPANISWERDMESAPPTLRVFFEYERPVVFPILKRTTVAHFAVSLENDLTVPQWK